MSHDVRSPDSPLPYPLWRVRPGGALLALLLLGVVGVALYAYAQQRIHGDVVTAMRTVGQGGVAWGLYICFDVYFIGLAACGITVAALSRLLKNPDLRRVSRIAEVLTLVSIPMGGLCVMGDLGRPMQGLLFLPQYARPQSPFFGTFTLVVSGCLFASLVTFWLASRADASILARTAPPLLRPIYRLWAFGWQGTDEERHRHRRVNRYTSLVLIPLLLIATSTLGFVFGIQGGRPGWYSALQAPSSVVLAGCSGVGLLIVIAAAIRGAFGAKEQLPDGTFRVLGNALWVVTQVYLYFLVVETLTSSYASGFAESTLAREIVFGEYAKVFWIMTASFVLAFAIPFVGFVRRRVDLRWLVAAGLLVNVAAFLRRFLLVVPSQTHGMLLNYPKGSYHPTWVELAFAAGLLALFTLALMVAVRLFPLVPMDHGVVPDDAQAARPSGKAELLHRVALVVTLLTGGSVTVAGLLLSMRVGTLPFLDPIVPYSPVIFIFGALIIFYSAAVYETIPFPKAAKSSEPA